MEFLRHIFGFNSESPLLFTQFYFWAFFAIVYVLFAIIMEMPIRGRSRDVLQSPSRTRLHLRNVFLMAVSCFFYYKTSGIFLSIEGIFFSNFTLDIDIICYIGYNNY